MDWFMLTAMLIAGWAIVSVFAGERVARHAHLAATAAAAAAKPPRPTRRTAAPAEQPTPTRLAA